MASASSYPTRSINWPSRCHPNSSKIEEALKKLKSFDLSSASLGAKTIQDGLLSLVEINGHVQELIFLCPSTQQALLIHDQGQLVEEALLDSLGLLDTWRTARDLILKLKEQVLELQSALRRKGCSSIETDLDVYVGCRKKVANDVASCLKVLRQAEGKWGLEAATLLDLDPCLVMVNRVIREVYGVTVGVLRSLLLFLSMPAKASGWTLLSRLVTKRRSGICSSKSEDIINEVARVDLALHDTASKNVDVLLVQGRLQALDASVRILEGELECLFKCLVEFRVSLSNILTS